MKDLSDVFRRDRGSGAMICWYALALLRRHSEHCFSHSRIFSHPDIIQYRADTAANVWFVPGAWFPCSWKSFTISFVIQLFLGRIIGYLTSNDKNFACFNRPSDRIKPSSSNFGCNPRSLLLEATGRPLDKAAYSFRNSVHWLTQESILFIFNQFE